MLGDANDGVYTFTSTVFLPSGSETATVHFESAIQGLSFLHIDLLSTNQVRIDDDQSTVFGTFPRNQPFILQVTLDIDQVPTAEVLLSGAGASGSRNYTIQPQLAQFARQFRDVRMLIGFPHTGEFYATNLVVEYRE